MDEAGLYEYIARLWAMLIWGNKQYVVDKLLLNHGLGTVRKELAELVWGTSPVAKRWDHFRKTIKGIGPAMMSEILCHVHPDTCILWNRIAYAGMDYLGLKNLPRYTYQLTGKKYAELSAAAQTIAEELRKAGIKDADLLTVDYFIWDELQGLNTISASFKSPQPKKGLSEESNGETLQFIHNDIRDKLADIGQWLGFKTSTEIKVAEGSKVDTVWESTIGNMGRVIYVFEVQTKGSIDSLILNLLKSLNNPAVQGVVAVSDAEQLNKIRKHAETVGDLGKKLRYWDYLEVLQNHEALEAVNESINRLGLVPQGF
ncbi:MAG: hypothetical protein JW832_18420 [Deltaproteobacteria bacterium]|nr:hypothetical protein [Deltaproteobacteria bacterium]